MVIQANKKTGGLRTKSLSGGFTQLKTLADKESQKSLLIS